MENENITIDEIGNIARYLDTELSIFERMKIKKRSMVRISGALIFYTTMMIIFSIFL